MHRGAGGLFHSSNSFTSPLQVRLSHHPPPQRGIRKCGQTGNQREMDNSQLHDLTQASQNKKWINRLKRLQKSSQYLHFADRKMTLKLIKIPVLGSLFHSSGWYSTEMHIQVTWGGFSKYTWPDPLKINRRGMILCVFWEGLQVVLILSLMERYYNIAFSFDIEKPSA